MSVEDPKSLDKTPQEVYEDVQNWVEAQSFGSAEYQAISDYIELQNLLEKIAPENERLLSAEGEDHRLRTERQVRRTDFRLALLQHQISQCRSRMPGYGKAYIRIEGFFESDLFNAAERDAAARFPEDKEQQEKFVTSKNGEIYGNVEDAIWRKHE